MTTLAQVTFAQSTTTIERTHTLTGKILFCEPYEANTSKGTVPGLRIQLDSCPYKLNVLKGSIKGAPCNASALKGATVSIEGTMRTYQEKDYFNPLTVNVTKQSNLGRLAEVGAIVHVDSLD